MTEPTVKIHVKEMVKPVENHKASQISLHWEEKVHADLKRNEMIEVIERVAFGEPLEWCYRLVLQGRNMSLLDKQCTSLH